MFYQSRFYDPEIARFIQPDSAGGGNRYTYVGNNPLRFVDPTGHAFLEALAISLAIIFAAVAIISLPMAVIGAIVPQIFGETRAEEGAKKGF
ncbi:MAG: hypothetical protein A2V67_00305 [Deltaproteobacteria bacterium RBG_13_61_14]|nr:MAG: hypothetical protein A2V67_00305 [Deltaproteobacteria bacterium RBG_13_61_14]